jgi:hypothetical protein
MSLGTPASTSSRYALCHQLRLVYSEVTIQTGKLSVRIDIFFTNSQQKARALYSSDGHILYELQAGFLNSHVPIGFHHRRQLLHTALQMTSHSHGANTNLLRRFLARHTLDVNIFDRLLSLRL